jgi:flagellar motility protein MotE (MotC chaperone)
MVAGDALAELNPEQAVELAKRLTEAAASL